MLWQAKNSAATNMNPPEVFDAAEKASNHADLTPKAPNSSRPHSLHAQKRKRRPARIQAESHDIKSGELPPQTGTVFNIWYNKWSGGDREDKYISKTHAGGRCSAAKDSGYTRADKTPGSFFCLFFARGLCPRGPECDYLHRLPTIHDIFNPNVDSFGRDKHSDYRDDMGGVGSFMRQNRTLYVGRIHVSDEIEEIVARHFQEWGQIERIRVLNSRGVAFITYSNEGNAQFAKEAMAHQSLDHSEILNVRWATVDPNPMAQVRDKRRIEEQAAEAIRRALPDVFVTELESNDGNNAKRRKLIEGSFGLEGYEPNDELWYARGENAINAHARFLEDISKDQVASPETCEKILGDTPSLDGAKSPSSILKQSTLSAMSGLFSRCSTKTSDSTQDMVPMVDYGSDDSDSN